MGIVDVILGSFGTLIMVLSGFGAMFCLSLLLAIVAFRVHWLWTVAILFVPF